MITLYIQGQLQDGWTRLSLDGEGEMDLANLIGAGLSRYDFEVRVLEDGEAVRLEDYHWEEPDA